MTPEAINRAIAESVGWHRCPTCLMWAPPIAELDDTKCQACLPDYFNDLNAIHEAVKTMPEKLQCVFGELLAGELGYDDDYYDGWDIGTYGLFQLASATSQQLSKTYLRTINKWVEEKKGEG